MPVDAASLLARIKRRKLELEAEPLAPKVNPYISGDIDGPLRRKKLLQTSPHRIDAIENELALIPNAPVDITQYVISESSINDRIWVEPQEPAQPVVLNIPLTPAERQRQAKLERERKQAEAREKVRTGADVPPPPRLTVKNVASVMGAEYIRDPTKLELRARQEMDHRRDVHEQANRDRALSPEERWEKRRAKLLASRDAGLHCLVVRIAADARTKAILKSNAADTLATGVFLAYNDSGMLVVEAGEREVIHFRKLVEKIDPKHTLVWMGRVQKATFQKWTAHQPQDALQFLRKYNLEGLYWLDKDLATANET